MKAKRSLLFVTLSVIAAFAMVLGLWTVGLNPKAYAEDAVNTDHITFKVTVDDEAEKSVSAGYGGTLAVKYEVTENTGVDELQLKLGYDTTAFNLVKIEALKTGALGAATVSNGTAAEASTTDYDAYTDLTDLANTGANIVYEHVNSTYSATGDVLIIAYFEVKSTAATAAAYEFSFADINGSSEFSHAYKNVAPENGEDSGTHSPVEIRFDSTATVYVRGILNLKLTGNEKVYDGVAATDAEIVVENVPAFTEQNKPVIELVWFDSEYKKLDSHPVNVGTYYVAAQSAETKYWNAYTGYTLNGDNITYTLEEYATDDPVVNYRPATYTITPKPVTVAFADKSEQYKSFYVNTFTGYLAENGYYTISTPVEGENLTVTLIPTSVLNADAGEYSYVSAAGNDPAIIVTLADGQNGLASNYAIESITGTFIITQKVIELGNNAFAVFNGGSFDYDGNEHQIAVEIAEDYRDVLAVAYSGGETGTTPACAGNGAIHVRYDANNNVIGYDITATFTINQAYQNNYKFKNDINELTAVLTIVESALTQNEVDELVAAEVKFYAIDAGEVDPNLIVALGDSAFSNNFANDERSNYIARFKAILLTIENRAGAYTKTYDAAEAYIGALINSVTHKLSASVLYSIGETLNYPVVATYIDNFDDYSQINAGVYTVNITVQPGEGYAFVQGVEATYTFTLTINKKALTITASSTVQYSDEAPVITVDNGANAWVEGESYTTYNTSAEALKSYVKHNYTTAMNAGTAYALEWYVPETGSAAEAKAAIEAILYNYDVTLATDASLTVAKKIINANDFDFPGYSGEYDGASHDLYIIYKYNGVVQNDIPDYIKVTFTNPASQTVTSVKNVADSGTYTATLTFINPENADNYTFEDGTNTNWTVAEGYASASKEATVEITAKHLTISIDYTKTTATFTLSGYAAEESLSDLVNLTYLAGGSDANIEENVYTISAYVENAITVSATNENTNYVVDNATMKNIRKVEYVAGTYDPAKSGETPTLPATDLLFDGFTTSEPAAVQLKHYTFKQFATIDSTDEAKKFDYTQTITENKVVYAVWEINPQYTLKLYYLIEKDAENPVTISAVEYYTDDEIRYGYELPALTVYAWFKSESWYTTDALEAKFVDGTTLSADTTLYANYNFDIGIGDVNANGDVDANDITLYRQWIVGGYEMTVVEDGNEWAIVTGENFDAQGVYFVKRVADSNAATADSIALGDNSLDIRDVSTIRMGMVGGYGFSIVEGRRVTGAELIVSRSITVDTLSDLFIVAKSGSTAKPQSDLTEVDFVAALENCRNNVTIDLNGYTITLKSLTITLAEGYNGTISIKNGTIITTDSITLKAPSGDVILTDVTMYDKDGLFNFEAGSNSLHFGTAVSFLKGDTESSTTANVKIPETTHVVLDPSSNFDVATIDILPVANYEGEFVIDIKTEAESSYTAVVASITTNGITYRYTTLEDALAAADENATITLVDDVTLTATLNVNKNVTLDLGDYTIYGANVKFGALQVAENKKLIINAKDGGVKGGSGADCIAISVLGSLDINGGNYSVGPDKNGLGNSCIEVRKNAAEVNIYGGTFSSEAAYMGFYYVLNIQQTAGVLTPIVKVYGGTFIKYDPAGGDDNIGGNFVADGYASAELETGVYTVGKVIATIGEAEFITLQSAIDAAVSGDTITLLEDITDGTGICTRDGQPKEITIDFGGHTYTVAKTAVGSTGTETQAMHWSNGSVVTLKNGTMKAAANVDRLKMAMQNYGTLTIDGMTMDFTNVPQNFYGTYTGAYAKYSELEVPSFCTNSTGSIIIDNSTLTFNAASNYGVYVESTATISGSTINGTVALSTDNAAATSTATITGSTVSGGVVAYFAGDCIVNDGDDFTVYASAESAQTAAAALNLEAQVGNNFYTKFENAIPALRNGDTIKLLGDVDIERQVNSFYNVTLDLNGYTISNTVDIWNDSVAAKTWSLISVQGGSLTITGNGKLDAKEDDCYAIDVRNGATLTIENGSFVGNISAVYVYEGKLYVNGGEYSIKQKMSDGRDPYRFTLNCYDASRNDGKATITVIGGTFDHFNPADNAAEVEHTNFLAEGYTVYLENGKYIVANATVATLSEMVTAMQNGYSKVVLGADLSYNGMISFSHDVTLDLNGHTLRSANSNALGAINGATLTINGNGEVMAQEVCVLVLDSSKAIINGGTYTTVDNFVLGTNGTSGRGGNTITVNGGTFNGNITTSGYVACGIYVANDDTVTVNGGTFNITNGVGILARSGNTTVGEDVIIYATGDGTLGKVGDSKVTVPAGEVLVVDYAANYPGGTPTLTNNSNYGVYYLVKTAEQFNEAISHGTEVVLAGDIALSAQVVVENDLTLDLNGKTLSYNGTDILASGLFGVKRGATLTINDTVGTGKIDATASNIYAAVALTLYGESAQGDKAKVVVNGGALEANYYAITGNGTRHNTEIVVNGGTLYGVNGTGIYNPQGGLVTINDGTIKGLETAIEMRAGDLVINNGTFAALSNTFSVTGNGSGTTIIGVIIAISQHTTLKPITVTINGGTFEDGIRALAMYDTVSSGHSNLMNVTINGGSFDSKKNAATKTIDVNNGNLLIKGGEFNSGADNDGLGCSTVYAANYGYVTIEGGSFKAGAKWADRYWTLNIKNDSKTTAKMEVKGGTFVEFDPSHPNTDDNDNYVAEGYVATEDGNSNYVVTLAPVEENENQNQQGND